MSSSLNLDLARRFFSLEFSKNVLSSVTSSGKSKPLRFVDIRKL